jgi:hypothetical protein
MRIEARKKLNKTSGPIAPLDLNLAFRKVKGTIKKSTVYQEGHYLRKVTGTIKKSTIFLIVPPFEKQESEQEERSGQTSC